jgi:hypothetical protein
MWMRWDDVDVGFPTRLCMLAKWSELGLAEAGEEEGLDLRFEV